MKIQHQMDVDNLTKRNEERFEIFKEKYENLIKILKNQKADLIEEHVKEKDTILIKMNEQLQDLKNKYEQEINLINNQ